MVNQRHKDFERIRNEFVNYYKNEAKGDYEYNCWLRSLGLNETLCYAQTHESFQWAKDMISQIREDTQNKYYKVLLAFPLQSMNGNVYTERNLIAGALSLKGKSPSMQHDDAYWLRSEGVVVTGAKYEDGAVEVTIKVPKTAMSRVCGYEAPVHRLIDDKKIVNVSLEGQQNSEGGFTFTDPPFTLLTKDILPGIPLARIFPIEAYLPFSQSQKSHKNVRQIKIVGLEEKMNQPNEAVDPVAGPTPEPTAIKADVVLAGTTETGGNPDVPPDMSDQKTVQGEDSEETPPLENTAQLQVDKIKAEQKAQSLQLQAAEWEAKYREAYTTLTHQRGQISQLQDTLSKRERHIDDLNKEKVSSLAEQKSFLRRLEDMTESRDTYKGQFESVTEQLEALHKKYSEVLKENLALNKQVTEANEQFLEQAKKAEKLEDKIKHVNRITKVRVNI